MITEIRENKEIAVHVSNQAEETNEISEHEILIKYLTLRRKMLIGE